MLIEKEEEKFNKEDFIVKICNKIKNLFGNRYR